MRKIIAKLYNNKIVRYIFFGGCSTIVNLTSFYILRQLNVNLNVANIMSIILAILFAYIVNSKFVFRKNNTKSFIKFIVVRVITMAVEIGAVWFLVESVHINEMIVKIIVQFVVVILNYIFSRFFVFTK